MKLFRKNYNREEHNAEDSWVEKSDSFIWIKRAKKTKVRWAKRGSKYCLLK